MKKGRSRTTQDIFDDKKSMFIADSRLGRTAGIEREVLSYAFCPKTKRPRLKQLGSFTIKLEQDNNIRAFSKSFSRLSYVLE